ncbi:MAG: LysR family transcriptional regulator [Clostridia bacterium]|nr:LysR family transcriptional regulator [Clostridia bacterium]
MELLQLKYFCDAAETQNFSKTAKEFGVPPSNISQCIKRLETELGTKLFGRCSNSIVLNEKGQYFYTEIADALNIIERAKKEIGAEAGRDEIKICIMAARRIVMLAVEQFMKSFPQVSIVISHKYSKNEEYDLVINDDLFEAEGLERKVIISEEIALALQNVHRLNKREHITVDELKTENFISMNSENSLCRVTKKFCDEQGFAPNNVIQIDDPFYMRKCVELGLGVAFVPTLSWKGMFDSSVTLKKIIGFSRNICAYRRNKYVSRVAETFLDVLIDTFEKEQNVK